jgi:hypothetical protein
MNVHGSFQPQTENNPNVHQEMDGKAEIYMY